MPSAEPTEIVSEGTSSITVVPPGPEQSAAHISTTPTVLDDAACRAMPTCIQSGHCSAVNGKCEARSWNDCMQVPFCQAGRCTLSAGVCTSVARCSEALVCSSEGRCTDHADGCIAARQEDCKKSTECARRGWCSIEEDACVAARDDDCKKTEACANGGACAARNGLCVVSCPSSEHCTKSGRCSERPAEGKRAASCIAISDAECKGSEGCREAGHCTLGLDGGCVAGDDVECRRARLCREQGRCTHDHGRCVPGSAAECSQSTVACKLEARCRFAEARCQK